MTKALVVILIGSITVLIQPTPLVAVDFIEIVEKEIAEQGENQRGFRVENFDQWIFSNQQKIGGAKKQLLERLQAEVDSIQSICKLSYDQKEKLLLAGRGDLQAFVMQYTKLRAKFTEKMGNQRALQNIWQEIQPLQQKYHGQIYGEGSLFEKVQRHLLDEEQSARINKLRREQRKFQYRVAVRQLILQFDQAAPLTHEKREKLLSLLDQHTLPPRSMTGQNSGHYLLYYILGQMAEIPEDELRPLFEKTAWKVIQQQIKQGKRMKSNLKKRGMVPEKD